jgi:hypothetical protein
MAAEPMSQAEKPKPINAGPSQAQGIAGFAFRARYMDLTTERRERLWVSILDSLGARDLRPASTNPRDGRYRCQSNRCPAV